IMRLLLDTHYAIELIDRSLNPQTDRGHAAIAGDNALNFVSVASLWEAAIKFRLGKLPVRTPVEEWPALLRVLRVPLLSITEHHVFAHIGAEPETKDPFDRLLLGVCAANSLELLTRDRHLVSHPLAWRTVPGVKK